MIASAGFQFIYPDVHGVLMLAGNWCPMLLVVFSMNNVALGLSMVVAILAIVDYCLKIHWKMKQNKERKLGKNLPMTDDEIMWLEERRRTKGY